mgnify:CR=1 FL=1
MAYGFFDYWKNLNDGFAEHNLSALTQLVGYKLLAEFNKAKFSGITLTDRELKAITNIHSLKSIHDAKAQLKQFGLIDFKTQKNKPTIYTLCNPVSKHEVNTEETQSKHEVNTAYNNNTNNNSSEDVKTKDKEKNAHTRSFNRSRDVGSLIEYFGLELDAELMRDWEEEKICDELTPYDLKTLSGLQKHYGVEKLKTAMEQAYIRYGRYTKVGAIQDCLKNPTPEKKGETRSYGRNERSVYADLR